MKKISETLSNMHQVFKEYFGTFFAKRGWTKMVPNGCTKQHIFPEIAFFPKI